MTRLLSEHMQTQHLRKICAPWQSPASMLPARRTRPFQSSIVDLRCSCLRGLETCKSVLHALGLLDEWVSRTHLFKLVIVLLELVFLPCMCHAATEVDKHIRVIGCHLICSLQILQGFLPHDRSTVVTCHCWIFGGQIAVGEVRLFGVSTC